MERVVYLLGAGFSVPLGLPLTANFLRKAWDIEDSHPDFRSVRETIRELAFASTYYNVDMTNVEELFSILEMRELLTTESERKKFAKFIADVIQHYTPDIQAINANPDPREGWYNAILGKESGHRGYTAFVASLFNLKFLRENDVVRFERKMPPSVYYSVITLNYDLVLEHFAKFIRERHEPPFSFAREEKPENDFPVFLVKLHGSADDPSSIIPPTWNKVLNERTLGQWKLAHRLLENANQIRVIGYSLPPADSYIKYLLKSAVVKSSNLKRVDVLCWVHEGKDVTSRRYKEFIRGGPHLNFPLVRYGSDGEPNYGRTENYLEGVRVFMKATNNETFDFGDAIEDAHFQIFPKLD